MSGEILLSSLYARDFGTYFPVKITQGLQWQFLKNKKRISISHWQ